MEKRVLHFIIEKKIGTNFINFVNSNFNKSNHFFIIFSKQQYDLIYDKNVLYVDRKSIFKLMKKIKSIAKSYDLINVHYLEKSEAIFIVLFLRRQINKMNWIMWGGDLYNENNIPFFWFKKYIAKKCSSVTYLIESDYSFFNGLYKIEKKKYYAKYLFNNSIYDYAISYQNNYKYDCNEEVNILVGNSATTTNNHLVLFEFLKKNEGVFNIFCPLSYGDKKYGDLVAKTGRELFGNHFFPIRDYIGYEEYMNLLSKMHIGFFGFKRQQGLGNINPLLLMGKKIFLFKNSPVFDEYNDLFKDQIFSIEDSEYIDFRSIMKRNDVPLERIEEFNVAEAIKLWEMIFK